MKIYIQLKFLLTSVRNVLKAFALQDLIIKILIGTTMSTF